MKLRIRRLMLLLCVAACFLSLSACTSQETAKEELDPSISAVLDAQTAAWMQEIVKLNAEEAEQQEAVLVKRRQNALASAIASWKRVMKDTGNFVETVSTKSEETDDGNYTTTITATFDKRQVEVKAFYSMEGELTSLSFSPEYTTAEKMSKALMNTVMGMGTVFLVLIFICLIISCFKFINVFGSKGKTAPVPAAPVAAAPAPVAEAEEGLADDLELVAVITAAIAAATGSSSDGLVVRSIKRKAGAKWKRA